jgi:uncharacterized membrane protein
VKRIWLAPYPYLASDRSAWYFVIAGLGQVSVVTPLNGTAPRFVLALACVFREGVEQLTWRVVLGTVCIVLGVFLLTAV